MYWFVRFLVAVVICIIAYFIQFGVYTKNYIQLQTRNYVYKGWKSLVRTMFTASTLKKVAVVCIEVGKTVLLLGLGIEVGWKLANGGMNEISPWRQYALNQMFPDDSTDIWTETKAATALDNRAMGRPHDEIYKVVDLIQEFEGTKDGSDD